jgi:hypothetical protein
VDVFDGLGELDFVEDVEACALPKDRFEQRALEGAHRHLK